MFGIVALTTPELLIDHPDISTPKQLHNEHTMVLGNLLGDGAEEFAKIVKNKYSYNKVMYAGLVYI